MEKQLVLLTGALLLLSSAVAQPATEVVLFDLSVTSTPVATNGRNISVHQGYDNQPFFHPDKDILYYTSADNTGHTDIVQYDYSTGKSQALTATPEREYSPTVTPDKKFVSCIMQRDNGAQDLGKYPLQGGAATVIINNLTVGYHTWLDDRTLFLFVLGEPATLRRYDTITKRDTILSTNIGRSLHRMPNDRMVSFVQKNSEGPWTIKAVNAGNQVSVLSETLPGREDLAWLSDGRVLMSDGKTLFIMLPGKTAWSEVKLTSTFPLKNISRIAVNAKGTKLAIVTEE